MERIKSPMETMSIPSGDGTRLNVVIVGNGPHRWLLPPGLGTPILSWKYLFEYFHKKMTIVTWDPRGCYDSEIPSDIGRLRVEDHVDDAMAVVRAMGWEKETFVTGGWSMGIEIGLEIYRRMPENIQALTLINGAFEHVLRTAFGFVPKADVLLRGTLHGMATASPVFAPLSSYLLGQDWAIKFLKSLGIVTANEDFFGEVVQEFRRLDFGPYFRMILKLDEHSARPILRTVKVPTLVTAGTMDKMTPMSVSRAMHERIPDSDFFVIPNGTHYTTLEYPEIVNLKLDQFFRNRVFSETW